MENRLSTEERIKAVRYFYQCNNYSNTAKQLNEELNKKTIQPSTIQRLVKKFENTGSVCDLPKSGRPSVINDLNIQTAVLREVNATPTSSCRILIKHFNILIKFHILRYICHTLYHSWLNIYATVRWRWS